MMDKPRIVVFRSQVTARAFDEADRRAQLVFFSRGSLSGREPLLAERLVRRSSMVVAHDGGGIPGDRLAPLLLSDYLVLSSDSRVDLRTGLDADATAALIGRIGASSRRFLLVPKLLDAESALGAGLCEQLVGSEVDSVEWLPGWLGSRSVVALHSAASLIRCRGGDRLERAEFARLFSVGEPQRGLEAFLAKQKHDFSEHVVVENR